MPNATRSRRTDADLPSEVADVMQHLGTQVASLEAQLDDLRQQLASEVRTRRVVVVDHTGFETVVASTLGDSGSLKLTCREDPGTHVNIYATEEGSDPHVGVTLSGGGNSLGMFEVNRYVIDDEVIDYRVSLNLDEDHGGASHRAPAV